MHQQKQMHSCSQKQTNRYQHQHKLENIVGTGKHQYQQSFNSQEHASYQQALHNHRKELSQQKAKVTCKPFASVSHSNHKSLPPHHEQQKEKPSLGDLCRQQTSQPIDLSGSTTPGSKLKVKQHLIDPSNTPKLLKHHDDVAEVGSTTASIEEMQDAHKHLWHPLFGKYFSSILIDISITQALKTQKSFNKINNLNEQLVKCAPRPSLLVPEKPHKKQPSEKFTDSAPFSSQSLQRDNMTSACLKS
ncbi:hypothetical protein NQ317_014967 [Molorchus minor]|uniref:Uncharacterized protein n=1 Tax=Molorchus minor TaxID=1323400 RepID=A0ABQ9JFX8_9CUCU|nr:hypothetical protein NQ317_014967 [Molorchus minor]